MKERKIKEKREKEYSDRSEEKLKRDTEREDMEIRIRHQALISPQIINTDNLLLRF